ncbi:aconitate hydratase AcnA [Desulfobacterales bacterium HSG16]|nr:aconitate hydratase AcnA [Desulfobacterales bacterium HSG16]
MEKQEFVRKIRLADKTCTIIDIMAMEEKGMANISRLPFSIRILVENLLRKMGEGIVTEKDVINMAGWQKTYETPVEIPWHPARVLMQDFTGVPAVVDLAAMRDAVDKLGGNPERINPLIPVDLIIDHSVQVDCFGTSDALKKNVEKEYERNLERYTFLKWAQKSFNNFKVTPPNSGICHQVNLEYLGQVIRTETDPVSGNKIAFPDSLVGTDSHTTMINGLGIMGWGVGGIEAEAVMLGQPYFMSIPQVIGVKMTGSLKPGVTATDMVLTITEMLRKYNVVEKFVEFFGSGMKTLNLPDRATIANMSPEYGATMGFFPVDEKTVEYLEMTGRADRAELVKAYTQINGMFYDGKDDPEYTQVIDFDLESVEPCIAGPAKPKDRIVLQEAGKKFDLFMESRRTQNTDKELSDNADGKKLYPVNIDGKQAEIGDGSVVIAAITSCTNTSNPFTLVDAGLLAKNAIKKGLCVMPHVKTSLAPGSKVVADYLEKAGLMPFFETLGFNLAAFGCTTCIGNSGPLNPQIEQCIEDNDLTVTSVLSGNRNFEARIHQSIKGNYLASPMLVIAFAIAGRIDIDMTTQPLGHDSSGQPVYLDDIRPSSEEIAEVVSTCLKPEFFQKNYETIFEGDEFWQNLSVEKHTTYKWDEKSTYIKNPPYFKGFTLDLTSPDDIEDASALAVLDDSVTTDHISPAGGIPESYPAGSYLSGKGITPANYNSYGSRRGNHEVMMRGTFGNIRIKNRLAAPKEGSFTVKYPEKEEMFIYDAAMKYKQEGIDLVVLAGKEYGTGSSRDWAAKGTDLLGIRAVIAGSYERIHKSNLVGMGVLPLEFLPGESWESLGIEGSERFSIIGIGNIEPRKKLTVKAVATDGKTIEFKVIARLNTDIDVEYFTNGGILPCVLRKLLS